mmetsp:Transcript_28767/g.54318  ORF Transcript_28767/g.54318 Transcript_28767/m.54318 type:complete len:209 (+) Transcript_28767:3731-4357(+)
MYMMYGNLSKNGTEWLTASTVTDTEGSAIPRKLDSVSAMQVCVTMSWALVGSSSSKMGRSHRMPRATEILWRMPPERLRPPGPMLLCSFIGSFCTKRHMSKLRSTSITASSLGSSSRPTVKLNQTDWLNSSTSCCTVVIMREMFSSLMGMPSTATTPSEGCRRRESRPRKVLLPAWLRPITPTLDPVAMKRLTFCSTGRDKALASETS